MTTSEKSGDDVTVWRLKTKPGGDYSDRELKQIRTELIDAMLSDSFIATGWHIDEMPSSAQSYVAGLAQQYPDQSTDAARRFAIETKRDDLVWIVDLDGLYHLAQVTGDWYYQTGNAVYSKHAINRFPCKWIAKGLPSPDVASGVRNGLRQGSAYCRIQQPAAKKYSLRVSGQPLNYDSEDFIELIDDQALEDLVGIYLQRELDGFLVPSSSKQSTTAYEFVVRSWDGKREAIAQVKSGNSSILDSLDGVKCERFLFALNGNYPSDLNGAKVLDKEQLINFAFENRDIMPATVKIWMT